MTAETTAQRARRLGLELTTLANQLEAAQSDAPKPSNDAPWMDSAWALLGLKEITGVRHNRRIVEMIAEVAPWMAKTRGDETPWCSAFVNDCMRGSGLEGTGSAAARSWLEWGVECEPRVGCIVVLERPPNPRSGHVAFLAHDTGGPLILLGGNQGNAVSVKKYPRSRVLGYRWPGAYP